MVHLKPIYCCVSKHCFSFILQLFHLFVFTDIHFKYFLNALVIFALIRGLFLNVWKILSIIFVSLFHLYFRKVFLLSIEFKVDRFLNYFKDVTPFSLAYIVSDEILSISFKLLYLHIITFFLYFRFLFL